MGARDLTPGAKPVAAILLAGLAACLACRFGGLDVGAATTEARAYALMHPVGAAALYALVYIVVAGFAAPGVSAMSVAGGALFGPWIGAPLAIACSVAGATISMLLARYVMRERIMRRFPDAVRRFDAAAARDGALALFAARLTPVLPFPLVNAAAGVSPMPARTFALVSALGTGPMTTIWVAAGARFGAAANVADFLSPQLFWLFALLATAPLAAHAWLGRRRRSPRATIGPH